MVQRTLASFSTCSTRSLRFQATLPNVACIATDADSSGLHLHSSGRPKHIFGFDSFKGFPAKDLKEELSLLGDAQDISMSEVGLKDISFALVRQKLVFFGLEHVVLYKSIFSDNLAKCADEVFSFVHLDCDLYGSYTDCLEFFYPLLSNAGIDLLDEFDAPPWPGCNKAVDEFLSDKPERLQRIESQNYVKYLFRKWNARLSS
jgi:hypothetical protein